MNSLKLVFASVMTLGVLFGMTTMVLFTALAVGGAHPAVLLAFMALTVVVNVIGWWIGPWITDFIQGWVYHLDKMEFSELQQRHPQVASFVEKTCADAGMPIPRFRIIQDDNPTAYTYGSVRSNARLVLSRGIFRFLDTEEVNAVVAHELGHIKHYDFAVMTLATTALELLYELYWVLTRMKSRGRNNPGPLIGMVAYVFWNVGTYVVLYLSRTREYMADEFSARTLGDPAPLQRALVRIAYGMAEVQLHADAKSQRLLQSTRAMGIFDPKAAPSIGNAVRSMTATDGNLALENETAPQPDWGESGGDVAFRDGGGGGFDPRRIEPIFLFDLFNPWATVSEVSSTHPLTGKRIRALNDLATGLGKTPLFRFERVDRDGAALDRTRLYGKFAFEFWIYLLPWMLPVPALLLGFFAPPATPGLVIGAVGLGMTIKGLTRYSVGSAFEKTTMYDLMCDPYASPLRGRAVELEGEIIGKALAGSVVGEDLTMKDRSGGLVMLNYESMLHFIGNLFFGFGTAKKAIGQRVVARGWFRRSVHQFVDLADMALEDGTKISSWTRFWGMVGGFVVMAGGVVVAVIGMMA